VLKIPLQLWVFNVIEWELNAGFQSIRDKHYTLPIPASKDFY